MSRPKRMKRGAVAGALAVAMLFGLLMSGCAAKLSYTIEAGDDLPDPFDLLGEEGGAYVGGYDPAIVKRPGTHTLAVSDADGKIYELTLTVKDTTEPVVSTKHCYYALGGQAPRAADFIDTIEEIDTYEAYFPAETPTVDVLGDFDVTFFVKDASGNESDPCYSLMTVIKDTQAPAFEVVPALSTHVGATVDHRKGLVVTDNCVGEVTVTVDMAQVDMTAAGTYPLTYTAVDAAGNTATAETTLRVYASAVTVDQVYAAADTLLQRLTTSDMTPAQKLEAVHRYLLPTAWDAKRPITLVGDAGHTDWVRAAYEALVGSREADAFGNAAVMRAFCDRLGLEYHVIRRAEGVTADTHYWLLINLGTTRDPRWYHFDCTPLQIQAANNGCFMTDDQLRAYNQKRPGFYAYDMTAYPASAKEAYLPSLPLEE